MNKQRFHQLTKINNEDQEIQSEEEQELDLSWMSEVWVEEGDEKISKLSEKFMEETDIQYDRGQYQKSIYFDIQA